MWVLELNDTEISLAEGLNVVYQQPGVAVILEDHVSFGDAALDYVKVAAVFDCHLPTIADRLVTLRWGG